jgi:hypothetical protein
MDSAMTDARAITNYDDDTDAHDDAGGAGTPILVRVRPGMLADIDAARAELSRPAWVRDAIRHRLGDFGHGELSPLVGATIKLTADLGRVGGLLRWLAEARGAPRGEIIAALDQLATERNRMAELRDHIVDRVGRRRGR